MRARMDEKNVKRKEDRVFLREKKMRRNGKRRHIKVCCHEASITGVLTMVLKLKVNSRISRKIRGAKMGETQDCSPKLQLNQYQ
jgi:hypothetical protein